MVFPMRSARGALWWANLYAVAFGNDLLAPHGPIAPGQAGYWVKLKGLRASEGSIDPPFTEDGKEFTLRIDNHKVKSLVLIFELNNPKYDKQELPKFFVNDREFEYSPLHVMKYEIPLSKTIAPIDQLYRIKVADPAGAVGWPVPHESAHEYALRVLQAPAYEKIAEAVSISVRRADGSQIKADKTFDPAERTYHYRVSGQNSTVELDVLCNPWATGMFVDGADVPVNETQTVVMEHAITQVNVQCQYADPRYTSALQQATYALKLQRSVHLENFNVALKISADQGYCAMRELVADGHGIIPGFVCRSAVSEPTFVAIYSNPQVDVILASSAGGARHSLPHGVAVPIELSGKRSKYTLQAVGSEEPWELPVEVIRAAPCSTLKCAQGKIHRKGLLAMQAAQAHLCLEEVCRAGDEGRCCEDLPLCDTMEEDWCPSGTELRRNGARCAYDPCSDEDRDTCCEKPGPRTIATTAEQHERHGHSGGHGGAEPHERHTHSGGHGGQRTRLRHHFAEAVRKKVAYYKAVGCSPTPSTTCNGEMCFFDETCLDEATPRLGGLGCWAAGISAACRFCGFGIYEQCHKFYDCAGNCVGWAAERRAWCFKNYGVHCPKLLHRVGFWQNESISGLNPVTDQIAEASGGVSQQRFRTVVSVGFAAAGAFSIASVLWRLAACRLSYLLRVQEGPQHQKLVQQDEEADYIE